MLRAVLPQLVRLPPSRISPSYLLPSSLARTKRMFALSAYRPDQPKTLQFQHELKHLPVPTLEASTERYVHSLRPILLERALKAGKPETSIGAELETRREAAKDFMKPGGLGQTLQARLIDVDRASPNNWLDDTFWLKGAYHSWRVPLPINSNWWILMADDLGIPAAVRESAPLVGEFGEWQIKRAAKLVERLVLFKVKLDSEQILPDSSRAGPFCMHQYTRVFGVTRIPQLPVDALVHSPLPHQAKHIIVISNDNYYKMDVMVGAEGVDLATLEAKLWAVAEDVLSRPVGAGVGVCSGDGRDAWTVNREHLLTLDPLNRQTMSVIEDALFIVSLDAHTIKSDVYKSSSPISQTTDLDAHIRNACAAGGQGRNRWWDKGVSVHVESNGRAGMVGEHSPCDALIPSIVADYVLAENVSEGPSQRGTKVEGAFERLEWALDAKALENIKSAEKTIEALVADSEGRMLWYDEYGVDWIKKVGKHSPDAYLQMALQLAYHMCHNAPVATYETASTRLFLHGRTDVIRSLSEESWRWVKAMREGTHDAKTLYELLTAATKAHNSYTRDASTGKGCDRHFMGLRMLMREGESHPFFDDPIFSESQSWILSTSGLSAGDRFFGTGFGTVWPEGYGINYLAGSKIIKFGIESKVSCPETSTELFRENLTLALRQMKSVCENGQLVESVPHL